MGVIPSQFVVCGPLRVPLLVVGSLRLLVLSFGGRGSFNKGGVVVLVDGSGCRAIGFSSGSSRSWTFTPFLSLLSLVLLFLRSWF